MARHYYCKPGKRYYYGDLEFWSQGGMVHIFDHRDVVPVGEHRRLISVNPTTYRERADLLGEALRTKLKYAQDRIALENLCNNMVKVCDQADAQGNPTDPRIPTHHLLHARHIPLKGSGVTVDKLRARQADQLLSSLPAGMTLGGAVDIAAVARVSDAPPMKSYLPETVLPVAAPIKQEMRRPKVERRVVVGNLPEWGATADVEVNK
jgi:hypothetical protein